MKRLLPLTVLLLAVATGAAAAPRWGESYLPNLPVSSHRGETLQFYGDLIKNKITVISFIYTSCRDLCPMVTARLAQLEDKLGELMGQDVFFVSISVDPENDTPQKLKEYAEAFQAGPGWTFITGKPEIIKAIRYKLGDRGAKISDHRNEVLISNGATGDWERSSVFNDIGTLAMSVRAMRPDWHADMGKDQASQRTASQTAAPSHRNLPGQALFAKTCASCHTIGQGDKVGPDLNGLLNRRSHEWVARYIADPESLRREQDPDAVMLSEKYRSIKMPRLGLGQGDIEDLMAYVHSKSFSVAADAQDARSVKR